MLHYQGGLGLRQGFAAETKISGSGSSSKHLKFLFPAQAPASESFWLWLQNNLVHWVKTEKHYIFRTTCLPYKLQGCETWNQISGSGSSFGSTT